MRQKRALARRAHARHLVERRGAHRLRPLRAVGADREAVRLVAEALDEVEHRIVVAQREGALARPVELLAARIAVDALGHAHDLDVLHAELRHDPGHGRNLPGPPVDEEEIGPGAALAVGVLLEEPPEAARQHLLHHPEVVARRQVLAADVELAVLAFLEAVGAGHDHRAHRVGALDVRVVVDLDPARGCVEPEGLGQPVEEAALRRRLGHLAREAFAGVAHRARDELQLLAPLGHRKLHPAARAPREEVGHEVGVVHGMRQEDQPGRRLVVVELGEEGRHHLARLGARAGAGVVVAVAPVLIGADEEDLNAGLPALHVERDHVGLRHAGRVDALCRLHLRQRADAVAQRRGAFELHRLGGLGHLGRERRLDVGGLALQEPLGIGDEAGVVGFGDVADAGGGAALDLVEQAGARAAFEGGVGAVAQKEHLLELVQRPVHGPRGGEGAIVAPLLGLAAAVLLDLREGVFAADEDVREGLVVAQEHVVARLELLDEVLLEQQSLGLGPRGEEHHRRGVADHPLDPGAVVAGAGVVRHARLEVARLAHVEHRALRIEHAVHARRRVERRKIAADRGMARHGLSGVVFRHAGLV